MRSKTSIILTIALTCIALLTWGVSSPGVARSAAQGKHAHCNAVNVAGSYAYVAFGSIVGGNPAEFPVGLYNSAGRLSLDGSGNYTITAKTSYNGTIIDEQFEGTYEVDANCGVTFFLGPNPVVFAFLGDNRKEPRGISLIQNTNVTFLTTAE